MVVGVVGYSQGTKAAGKRLCTPSEDLCTRVKTYINKRYFQIILFLAGGQNAGVKGFESLRKLFSLLSPNSNSVGFRRSQV